MISVSKHTANQPAFYMEPVAMNQDKFVMPKNIVRPEGFKVEEMNAPKAIVRAKVVEKKPAKVANKKEA